VSTTDRDLVGEGMGTPAVALLCPLAIVALLSAAAASRCRLATELLPAVVVTAFALLSVPAFAGNGRPIWIVATSVAGASVALASSVWAWRTRSAQLRCDWWRTFERDLDYEQIKRFIQED
jgi:hypothetical protein